MGTTAHLFLLLLLGTNTILRVYHVQSGRIKTAGRDSGMRCSLLPLIKYSWAVQSAVYCEVTYLSIAISHTRYLEWPVLCEQCFPEEALYGANCIWNYMEATFIFRLDPQTERFTVVTPYENGWKLQLCCVKFVVSRT